MGFREYDRERALWEMVAREDEEARYDRDRDEAERFTPAGAGEGERIEHAEPEDLAA